MDAAGDRVGRITFPGNPWPEGHAIKEFVWSGRLEADGDVWMDFHLESENYYAEREVEDDEDHSDWEAPIVWGNYHACTLSSTHWPGQFRGGRVGGQDDPVRFGGLCDSTVFADDVGPDDEYDYDLHVAFGINLLGHDGVAGHSIRLTPNGGGRCDVHWTGRIAQAYAGLMNFEHTFEALATGVKFDGFVVTETMSDQVAQESFRRAVIDHERFELQRGADGLRRFVLLARP